VGCWVLVPVLAGGVFVPLVGVGASWFTCVDSLFGAAEPVGAGVVPIAFVTGAVVVPGS
jgi:hypothetical protein